MSVVRKILGLSAAMAVVLAGPAFARPLDPTTKPPASLGQAAEADTYNALAGRLNLAINEERWEDALATLKAIAAHPDFPRAAPEARLAAFYLTGILNLELDRPEAAVAPLVTATGMPGATTLHWFRRIEAENRSGDRTAAAGSLTEMLRRFPEALEQVSPTYLIQRATDPDLDKAVGFELRAILLAQNWHHPADSRVWVMHIDELLARSETGRARAVVDRITSPSEMIQLYALRRYDVLNVDLPPLDMDRLMIDALAVEQHKVAAPDADMAAFSHLSNSLFQRGQLAEALAVTDAALALPEPETGTDAARDRVWVMDTRARSLMALGRSDEAVAQMQTAAAETEEGGVNVSQTINLAWLYLRLGRDAEAMAMATGLDMDNASPFGVMQAVQIRACAAAALGDGPAAETAYAYLAAHWRDAPRAAMDAMLCRDDVDGAAAVMVQRLDDPELAATALTELHHYLPAPAPTPFDARLNAGDATIAARPEVIAARDRVGRLIRIPTLGGQF